MIRKCRYTKYNVKKNSPIEEIYLSKYEDLCFSLADVNSQFESEFSAIAKSSDVPSDKVIEALRKSTIEQTLSPVACGTALHSSASVRPLLDMVISLLPTPNQRDYHITDEVDICVFVFKVRHDPAHGQLNYVRLFRGEIEEKIGVGKTLLVNANTGEHQTDYQIFTPFSDILQASNRVGYGNIAVLTGLKNTKTGDTLVNCTHVTHQSAREGHIDFEELAPPADSHYHYSKRLAHLALEGIETPLPVFSCTIEPPNLAMEKEFQKALNELLSEDPSLRVRDDQNTGQKILEGMGELQIEVLKERFMREYKLNVFLGPLQIGYRERPTIVAEHEETIGGHAMARNEQKIGCTLGLRVEPSEEQTQFKGVKIAIESPTPSDVKEAEKARHILSTRPNWVKAINDGCRISLHNGPIMGFPVTNVCVSIVSFAYEGRLQTTLLSACANQCLSHALSKAEIMLLEPIMEMEVTVLAGSSGTVEPDAILRELVKRRATVMGVDNKGRVSTITALIPLAETMGMAKTLRSISSGLASFHMEFKDYQSVDADKIHANI